MVVHSSEFSVLCSCSVSQFGAGFRDSGFGVREANARTELEGERTQNTEHRTEHEAERRTEHEIEDEQRTENIEE